MTATLLSDIHSYGKGRQLYGRRGERVEVISKLEDHQPAVIVEAKGGERFPVRREELQIIEKQK